MDVPDVCVVDLNRSKMTLESLVRAFTIAAEKGVVALKNVDQYTDVRDVLHSWEMNVIAQHEARVRGARKL